jgi:hypothetical protein
VADLLVDDRATHYWDGDKTLGQDVAKTLGSEDGTAAWDVFLVYGPDASWGDAPKSAGSPVISEASRLERALEPYLSTT